MISNYCGRIFFILVSSAAIFDETRASLFPINSCENDINYPFWFLSGNKCTFNPDVVSDVPAMIVRHGYESETHQIVTPDGYILSVFRVLPKETPNGKVIFMQHGIGADSSYWCDKGPEGSHAFYFADAGYDIWLGNIRGSTYSTGHVTLSIEDQAYWNFTIDTLAAIDIRLQLQLIVNVTESDSVYYLGHSMGTTMGFMYLSEFPEESKPFIKGFITLAPVIYFYDSPALAPVPLLLTVIRTFYRGGVLYGETKNRVAQDICTIIPTVCRLTSELLFGKSVQFPSRYLLLMLNSHLRGAGVYMFNQYAQYMTSKEFQKYDWGQNKNAEVYGSASPPLYNLSQIEVPVFMYWGKNDPLSSQKAITRTTSELGPNAKIVREIAESVGISFCHTDFVYAKDLRTLVLDVVLNDIQTVTP